MFGEEPLQLPIFDIARSTKQKLNVEKGIILKLFGSSEKIRDGIVHSITPRKKNFFHTVTEMTEMTEMWIPDKWNPVRLLLVVEY